MAEVIPEKFKEIFEVDKEHIVAYTLGHWRKNN